MQIGPDAGAPAENQRPALLYHFEIPEGAAGEYTAYLRGAGPNTGGDSCYVTVVRLDGTTTSPNYYTVFASNGTWAWKGTPSLSLTSGRYAVRVSMREDGFAADKVVLQLTSLAAPVGQGPAETPPVSSAAPFTVWSPTPGFVRPNIVLQYDGVNGVNWATAEQLKLTDTSMPGRVRDAVIYLQEGIRKMTAQTTGWAIGNAADLSSSQGILLTTLAGAPTAIKTDPVIVAALADKGGTDYGVETNESYYIRTEANRTLIVANRLEGLIVAVPELLESVGYEVIGMGPNWIHVPDQSSGLTLNLEKWGHPQFFTRNLHVGYQSSGHGTISLDHTKPPTNMPALQQPDELVEASYHRYLVGRRLFTSAAEPTDAGARPSSHHDSVIAHIRANFAPGPAPIPVPGFLAPATLGPEGLRPLPGPANDRSIWLSSDTGKNYVSNGVAWGQFTNPAPYASLDVSLPWVRTILLNAMIAEADSKCFGPRPNDACSVMVDPEDGVGYSRVNLAADPNWFPAYRVAKGAPLAASGYRLHGFKGLNHPGESWDPLAPSDFVYGLDEWLLREYDAVAGNQTTSTGKRKKDLIRLTHYSYNYWDVPPNFNLDSRIRIAIAGYSKNRQRGQWQILRTYKDVFDAFKIMLPASYQGYRWTYSLDSSSASSTRGILGANAINLAKTLRNYALDGNCKSLFLAETDFNFGKYGLLYYLLTRVMLNPQLSDADIDAAAAHWQQQAYGAASGTMGQYQKLVLEGAPVALNGPQLWAEALAKIDAAYATVGLDAASRQRLDDLKAHWYHYYFVDTEQRSPSVAAFKEFVWKAQMGYQAYLRRDVFAITGNSLEVPYQAANFGGSTYGNGPAHYTPQEINGASGWWPIVRSHWPVQPVVRFPDVTLADGTPASAVDFSDLVQVAQFGTAPATGRYQLNGSNGSNPGPLVRASAAGATIGFRASWPDGTGSFLPRAVSWGLRRYDVPTQAWEELVDIEQNYTPSHQVDVQGIPGKKRNVVDFTYSAATPGIYQFELGATGDYSSYTDLNWNHGANPFESGVGPHTGPLTYDETGPRFDVGQMWFYAPKGTTTIDFQYLYQRGLKATIYKRNGPNGTSFIQSRVVDIPCTSPPQSPQSPERPLQYLEARPVGG